MCVCVCVCVCTYAIGECNPAKEIVCFFRVNDATWKIVKKTFTKGLEDKLTT